MIDNDGFLTDIHEATKATRKLPPTMEKYQTSIEQALLNAPLLPTEANVQEWIVRFDRLQEENRMSEVKYLHDWMNISFGRGDDDKPIPVDLRLHRRLGELYLSGENHEKAVGQLELSRQLSPRDIFSIANIRTSLSRPKKHGKN